MAEERVTERTDVHGNVVERTVDRNTGSGGGRTGFLIAFALLILAAIVGFYLFTMQVEESRQTDAISEASESVGQGARQVGEGVEKVGNAAEHAANELSDQN